MTARRPVTHFEDTGDGPWRVVRMAAIAGSPLTPPNSLSVIDRTIEGARQDDDWPLRGMSYGRYVSLAERRTLEARQPVLGRPEATRAALIPITKSAAWWDLAQDERRAILEERSAHIQIGLGYLPAIARRLYQSRDLGEPFDFLTWFEYAPDDGPAFDELLSRLRNTEEWRYVVREIDIRLERTS